MPLSRVRAGVVLRVSAHLGALALDPSVAARSSWRAEDRWLGATCAHLHLANPVSVHVHV